MIYPYKIKYNGKFYNAGENVPNDVKAVEEIQPPITDDKAEVVVEQPKKTIKSASRSI